MTRKQNKRSSEEIKALMSQEEDFLRPLIKVALQEVLEGEMEEAVGAADGPQFLDISIHPSNFDRERL